MKKTIELPATLMEAIRYFSDPDVCLAFMVALRWPNSKVICPQCGSDSVIFLANQRRFKCRRKHPRRQFSVKVGTILEDSPIGLDKWFTAMWMIANCKNGVSSYEIARELGVTQKTAWFMDHRIRLAMQTGTFEKKFSGQIESDETYIGGLAKNMHKWKREQKMQGGRGTAGKAIVMGVLERHGEEDAVSQVRAKVIHSTATPTIEKEIREAVEPNSELFTDELASYAGLSQEYVHQVINHTEAYVKGKVHTNGIENFWSLLKRTIRGTYVSVEPFHLFRYVDEQSFRFNNRKDDNAGRFANVVSGVTGKRIMYKDLVGKESKDDLSSEAGA
jgi:transposase-like protein